MFYLSSFTPQVLWSLKRILRKALDKESSNRRNSMGAGDLSPRGKIIAASFGLINTCLIIAAMIIFFKYLDLSPHVFLDLSKLLEKDISKPQFWTYQYFFLDLSSRVN